MSNYFLEKNIKSAQLYIGVQAGRIISNKIDNAKKSVKIVSPYFGKDQIEQLIKKQSQNVDIHVISTDGNSDFRNPEQSTTLKIIIKQEQYLSEKNKIKFDRLKLFIKLYTVFYFLFLGVLLYLQLQKINSFLFQYKYLIGLFVLIIPIMYKCYKSIKVFNYEYKTSFPVYFVKNPLYNYEAKRAKNKFIHSKIYIIDDEIAFVGSVNFTNSGLFYSYETCLMIEDKEAIIKLSKYFDELYQTEWMKVNINELGKRIYNEPIN
jgi:phosphatidylserine/phosphatidylglycerophosphate/cardiolipin synthase-like enzyme